MLLQTQVRWVPSIANLVRWLLERTNSLENIHIPVGLIFVLSALANSHTVRYLPLPLYCFQLCNLLLVKLEIVRLHLLSLTHSHAKDQQLPGGLSDLVQDLVIGELAELRCLSQSLTSVDEGWCAHNSPLLKRHHTCSHPSHRSLQILCTVESNSVNNKHRNEK